MRDSGGPTFADHGLLAKLVAAGATQIGQQMLAASQHRRLGHVVFVVALGAGGLHQIADQQRLIPERHSSVGCILVRGTTLPLVTDRAAKSVDGMVFEEIAGVCG